MLKLTTRESRMLGVLVMILMIGVGIVFIIMPLSEKNALLQAQYDSSYAQYTEMQTAITLKSTYDKNLAKKTDEVNVSLAEISDVVKPEEFDIYLNSVLTNLGVKVTSVSYSEITAVTPSYLENKPSLVEYDLKDSLGLIDGAQDDEAEAVTASNSILKQTITVQFTGTQTQLTKFINELNAQDERFYVNQATMDYESGDITCSFDVYSVDKSTVKGTNSLEDSGGSGSTSK